MVAITIESVLWLPVMRSAVLLAGANGLNNEIHSITVHDNLPAEMDADIATFDGDIYITSLFFGKDNPGFITDFMKYMNTLHASAVFVIDEFVDHLPQAASQFCNEHRLPVVLLDRKTPYSRIISEIMEYKLAVQQAKSVESNLKALTSYSTAQSVKESMIRDLNPDFLNYAAVLCCMPHENDLSSKSRLSRYVNVINRILKYPAYFAAEYRGSLLIVISRKSRSLFEFQKVEEDMARQIRSELPDSVIGISDILSVSELGICITQAYMAASSNAFDADNLAYYQNLGISKLLIEIEGNPAMERFYTEAVSPVEAYDERNHTELLKTIFILAENDMDFKRTSDAMYLHENTVRYRVSKAKELMPYGRSDIDFFVTLSIVYKIHLLQTDL